MRMRRGGATVDIRSSIFCGVREPAPAPLCGFYKAAFARVLARFALPAVDRSHVMPRHGTAAAASSTSRSRPASPRRGNRPCCRSGRPKLQHDLAAVDAPCACSCCVVVAVLAARDEAVRAGCRAARACSSCRSRPATMCARGGWARARRCCWPTICAALGVEAIGRDERLRAFARLQVPAGGVPQPWHRDPNRTARRGVGRDHRLDSDRRRHAEDPRAQPPARHGAAAG